MWNETVSYNPAIVCQMTSHYSQHLSSRPGPGRCWSPVKLTSNRGQKQKIYQVENPFGFLQLNLFGWMFQDWNELLDPINCHQSPEYWVCVDIRLQLFQSVCPGQSPPLTQNTLLSLAMKIILWSRLGPHYSFRGYECDVLPIHLNWSPLSPGWTGCLPPWHPHSLKEQMIILLSSSTPHR